MPNHETSRSRGWQERWNNLPHLPEREMPGAHGCLPLPANAAGADAACEGTLGRACREAVASPRPRSHPQETAGRALAARLGDGGVRLLPTLRTRQPPPTLQALRVGGEEE